MIREEAERRLYPELKSLLILPLPDDWERRPLYDGHTVYGVSFYYRGNQLNSVDISYWDDYQKYQTWVYGSTDEEYPILQEAIERVRILMDIVTRDVYYGDIASVENEEYRMNLLEREGIGRGTISRLADTFGTLQKLQKATIEDIEAVPGIGSDKAWLIISHLHPNVRYHELWDPDKGEWVDLYCVPREVINQCARTHTYMTQKIRNKYRLTQIEIRERGLVKIREGGRKVK